MAGAVYGARGGWERALYYARPQDPPGAECSFRRPHWHRAVARECAAVANGVALMDLPGFTRFEVAGGGAAEWLDHLFAGTLPQPGRVRLSYACSPRGGVVMEATVLRWPDGRFWLISAASAALHDAQWLRAHLSSRFGPVAIENVSARYGTLVLAGPRARELLSRVTSADLAKGELPWLGTRTVRIAGIDLLAMRLSYVGELGFELHVLNEDLAAVYVRLREAGAALGLESFGLHAMESLRLEKCYRSWKADLTSEYSPLSASLGRFVELDKTADFIGREALRREAAAGPRERLVPLLVEAHDADAAAVSIVYRGGERVGIVTSGGYGYRLKRSIALAYVRAGLATAGTQLEVEILGERRRAVVEREPLYDPDNQRLRG